MLTSRFDAASATARDATPIPITDDDAPAERPAWTRANSDVHVPTSSAEGVRVLTHERANIALLAEYLNALHIKKGSRLCKELKKKAVAMVMVRLKLSIRDLDHEVYRRQWAHIPITDAARRI